MRKILLITLGFNVLFGADTFTDKTTGLTWQDNSASKTVQKTWSGAKEYCENLTLGGYDDWRLPSIRELQSIVNMRYVPAIKSGFKNAASSDYWSSSEIVPGTSGAWGVNFGNGIRNYISKSKKNYVRCVRGRQF